MNRRFLLTKGPAMQIRIAARSFTVLLLLGVMAAAAGAHHSAAQFDFGNTVLVTGKVVSARLANPHMRLILEVTDTKRGTRVIEFEGHSRANMQRQGLMPEMFGVGDTITIRIAPMRNGSDGGYVTAVRTPSGKEIGRVGAPD
jgi:hypothetical protein